MTERASDERLAEMLAALGDTIEADPISWRAFSPADLRSIITELQELRKAVNSAWRIIDDVLIGPDPDEAMARLIDVLNPLATGDKP